MDDPRILSKQQSKNKLGPQNVALKIGALYDHYPQCLLRGVDSQILIPNFSSITNNLERCGLQYEL